MELTQISWNESAPLPSPESQKAVAFGKLCSKRVDKGGSSIEANYEFLYIYIYQDFCPSPSSLPFEDKLYSVLGKEPSLNIMHVHLRIWGFFFKKKNKKKRRGFRAILVMGKEIK